MRKFKKVEAQCKHVKASVPGLENQLEQIKHSIVLYESQIKKQQVQIGTIKKEIEASMDYYMQEESRGKEKTILFQQSYAEVVESEKELVLLKKEELQRERNIMELKNLKERVQHQVVSKMNKFKEAVEVAQLKDMIRADLKKKKKDTFRRLHEFQQLYELVKSQRNKFVNLIQASSQSIAEMKEKLKILSNELEILRTETMSKEKLLAKARLDRSTAQADREHVRTELNKCAFVFKQKQEVIEEQISEIDKLNSIISLTERDMLRLKRMYEVAVEARNHTGILLIDRNDELCILYEKANIQEEVIRQGEVVLTQKGNEIRSLNIEVKELRRSIDVKRKLAPEISLYDKQIVLHKQQLLEAKQQAVKLEKDLEDPNNNKRWRKLEGKIPDKEELNAKLKQLEDRLNDKREQLLEKTLILEEISSLSQRLKAQATGGRSETLELAKRVNDFQSRIRQITRKMMATVSELSMFQAQAMSLKEENTELKEIVQTAGENLENGIAPTEDAEKEWYRMENERIIVAEMSHRRKELDAMALDANKTLTTAIPRPNAYIPEDLGIPKPYGTSAPFKPTDPGATMRHIRKPLVREIQI